MTSKLTHNGADRVRIEIDIDGKTSVMELRAEDGEHVWLSVAIDAEMAELPHDNPFREFEPTGRVQVTLSAFGHRASTAETGAEA